MTSFSWSRGSAGCILGLLLIVAYTTGWRPARGLLTKHVVLPTLTSIDTERAGRFGCDLSADGLSITIRSSPSQSSPLPFRMHGGILFLLPAVILAALLPYAPYWLYVWLLHLLFIVIDVGAVGTGIAWTNWGFSVHEFIHGYLIEGFSLAAPLVILYSQALRDRL